MRFIKLYEKMTEWEWYDDVATFRVFTHLLLTANWKDTQWHGITIKRGQRVASLRGLASEVSLTDRQTRTAIDHLKATGEITTVPSHHYSIITIENYEFYQGSIDCTDTAPTHESTHQTTHNRHSQPVEKPTDKDNGEELIDTQNVTQATSDIEDIELYRKKIPTVSKKVPSKADVEEIVKAYNEICVSLPHVSSISDDRVKKTRARLSKHSKHELILAFQKAEASDFATGRSGECNKWCNFDWLMRSENNLVKMLEGNYDNKENHGTNISTKDTKPERPSSDVTERERASIKDWVARKRLQEL